MQTGIRSALIPLRNALVAVTLLAIGLPTGSTAGAFSFTVNTTDDGNDLSLDAVCDASGAPGDQCTLRAAIQESNDIVGTNQVILPPGTYTIDSENFPHHTVTDEDGLIIQGGGASTTIVRQQPANRIFEVADDARLDLRDVTVRDGVLAAEGAGIRNHGILVLRRSAVVGNQTVAAHGGGIYASNTADETLIFDSVIGTPADPNIAGGAGANVVGGRGGGIALEGGALLIRRSVIEANEANEDTVSNVNGSGIFVNNPNRPVRIFDTTIRGNRANEGSGGGIYYLGFGGGDSLLVERTTISGNQADPAGGGLRLAGPSMTIRNSTISGNSAPNNSGGVNVDGDLQVIHSTIAGNSARLGLGPGVGQNSGTTTFTGTILRNLADQNCVAFGGSFASGGSNIDSGNSCGFPPGQSNIDPLLRPLGNYGGPTFTHALRPASPAINAAAAGTAPPTDQRRVPRNPDIGAYEFVRCKGVIVNRVGTSGSDDLTGTSGADGFLLFGGADTARARGGADGICGGAGADLLIGGGARDKIAGGKGGDEIRGGSANDRLLGQRGNDVLKGGTGTDYCVGGPGTDTKQGCESGTG
jgi:CSLREA domain-containing protein